MSVDRLIIEIAKKVAQDHGEEMAQKFIEESIKALAAKFNAALDTTQPYYGLNTEEHKALHEYLEEFVHLVVRYTFYKSGGSRESVDEIVIWLSKQELQGKILSDYLPELFTKSSDGAFALDLSRFPYLPQGPNSDAHTLKAEIDKLTNRLDTLKVEEKETKELKTRIDSLLDLYEEAELLRKSALLDNTNYLKGLGYTLTPEAMSVCTKAAVGEFGQQAGSSSDVSRKSSSTSSHSTVSRKSSDTSASGSTPKDESGGPETVPEIAHANDVIKIKAEGKYLDEKWEIYEGPNTPSKHVTSPDGNWTSPGASISSNRVPEKTFPTIQGVENTPTQTGSADSSSNTVSLLMARLRITTNTTAQDAANTEGGADPSGTPLPDFGSSESGSPRHPSPSSSAALSLGSAEDLPKSPPSPSSGPFGYPSPKEYDAIDAAMHLDLQNNPLYDGVLESGVNFVLVRPTVLIGLVALWNAVHDFQKRGLYVKCTSQKLKPSEAFFALWMFHYVKCTLWCPITTTRVLAVAFLLLDRLLSPDELGMPELSHRSPTMTVSLYMYWLTLLACMPAIIISHVWLTVCIPFKKTLATQFYTTVSVPAYFFGLCSIVAFTLSIMMGVFAGTPEAPGTLVYLVKVAHPLMMNGLLWDYIFK